jgi:hypothetical protein
MSLPAIVYANIQNIVKIREEVCDREQGICVKIKKILHK